MPPARAAEQLLFSCLLGGGLGLLYAFLRPLRPRFTGAADGIFLAGCLWGLVFLDFRLCGGDLRPACFPGIGSGWVI